LKKGFNLAGFKELRRGGDKFCVLGILRPANRVTLGGYNPDVACFGLIDFPGGGSESHGARADGWGGSERGTLLKLAAKSSAVNGSLAGWAVYPAAEDRPSSSQSSNSISDGCRGGGSTRRNRVRCSHAAMASLAVLAIGPEARHL